MNTKALNGFDITHINMLTIRGSKENIIPYIMPLRANRYAMHNAIRHIKKCRYVLYDMLFSIFHILYIAENEKDMTPVGHYFDVRPN